MKRIIKYIATTIAGAIPCCRASNIESIKPLTEKGVTDIT